MIIDYTALQRAIARGSPRTTEAPADYERDAVCLLLLDRAETMLLLIQKTDSAGYHWRDHVAMPGGRIEPSDPGPSEAALRELQEELGIEPETVEVLGEFGHFQTATSKNDLAVVVARWKEPTEVRPDAREVARVMEIPLADLVDLHISQRLCCYDRCCGAHAPVYAVPGTEIWGVTARILYDFLDMLLSEKVVTPRSAQE